MKLMDQLSETSNSEEARALIQSIEQGISNRPPGAQKRKKQKQQQRAAAPPPPPPPPRAAPVAELETVPAARRPGLTPARVREGLIMQIILGPPPGLSDDW